MNQLEASTACEYGATVLRVSLGTMWIAHALLKWFVVTLPGTARYFETLSFPGLLAYVAPAALRIRT